MSIQTQLIRDDDALLASLSDSLGDSPADYGAIYTRRWVVELLLDLSGYTEDKPLGELVAVEPACGDGAFLGPMVERLSSSLRMSGKDLASASSAIRAFDLQPGNVEKSRAVVATTLLANGWTGDEATATATSWVQHNDFLLGPPSDQSADFVLGNPPYIRLEDVSPARSAAYRSACPTMGGRADIYVGFFEIGLRILREGGSLGYICADRWMRNQYGRQLRAFVSSGFAMDAVVHMHDVDAFEDPVSAYPAITVLRRGRQNGALVASTDSSFGEEGAQQLLSISNGTSQRSSIAGARATRLRGWFEGEHAWPDASPERIKLLRQLEADFPPLEDAATGTRIGIGVASGADRVFITTNEELAEPERMLPLLLASDVADGSPKWSGHFLVNPWREDGSGLVDLEDWPRFHAYLESHAELVKGRNCVKNRPESWHRTIDRVAPVLTHQAKLVFPDIKASIHPVLDEGNFYPHHNLYWATSSGWDLEVLGGILLSRVAQMFIEAYAVRMRGGYLRFQAQYLRTIRVPRPESLSDATQGSLRAAFRARDAGLATKSALVAYGLGALPE